MKIDYFTLLSPEPINLSGVGRVISPTLKQISKITLYIYYLYIDTMQMTVEKYYDTIKKQKDEYLSEYSQEDKELILAGYERYLDLSADEKLNISFMDILLFDKPFRQRVESALNFFFLEKVKYEENEHVFFVYAQGSENPTGVIHRNIYDKVVSVILTRNKAETDEPYGNVKPKNKAALRIWEKIKAGNKKKRKKADPKMELGNLISSLSIQCSDLNILNVWDLTIFQLYDQFARQQVSESYKMTAHNYAVWGDKENKFDHALWYTNK